MIVLHNMILSSFMLLVRLSWDSSLIPRPQNMVDAMVLDTSSHLKTLESERSALESALADGKGDEAITLATQKLCQTTKDYKVAAAHVKRASAKPKPKQKKPMESEAEEPPHGAA